MSVVGTTWYTSVELKDGDCECYIIFKYYK